MNKLTNGSDAGGPDKRSDVRRKLAAVNARRAGRARVPSNIGMLKIAVAGDTGIGKTSLISHFLQIAEVVERLDPATFDHLTLPIRSTLCSTIPDAELHTGEEKFNVTFYDTPGFGTKPDAMATIRPVTDFLLSQFGKTNKIFSREKTIPDGVIMKLLSGGTGAHSHVDVLLYCFLHRVKPVDIEYIKRLHPAVNVVPIIIKSDTLRPSDVFALKISILEDLQKADIKIYGFGLSHSDLIDLANAGVSGTVPFAVWNSKVLGPSGGPGEEERPVVNEFEALKNSLLHGHVDDLRGLTGEKFVRWRNAERR